jgi:hypothetical protein
LDACAIPGVLPAIASALIQYNITDNHVIRFGHNVTIFLETFGNKSYGMKLNALDPVFGSFANDSWADNVATRFLIEWKKSILQMLTKLTDTISGCFNIKHEHTSIGFGFSTSYCDSKHQLLYSVCKSAEWISAAGYESYCTMALHSILSPHTTHFASGPVLRIQSYIEAFNCITNRQCGSRKPLYCSGIFFARLLTMST